LDWAPAATFNGVLQPGILESQADGAFGAGVHILVANTDKAKAPNNIPTVLATLVIFDDLFMFMIM
jgi:hypothetical protein